MGQVHRRRFVLASSAVLAAPIASLAQPVRVRRIGFLSPHAAPSAGVPRLFRESLRRAGYEVGKNLVVEARYADARPERLPALAAELVRLDIELIVAQENAATDAAKQASQTIPIVMWSNVFPVERRLATGLARPGGNVTGTVWWAQPADAYAKIFQLLKEAVPNANRSAMVWDPTDPVARFFNIAKTDERVTGFGLSHTRIAMTRPEDLENVLDQLKLSRAEVLYVSSNPVVFRRWREIAAFAIEQRIASISHIPQYLEVGGLLSYGPDGADVRDRTVSYVVRILEGAKPGDLPIEQASKYVMALNAKTAKAIGFQPPPSFMLRVDKVVD